MRGRNLAKIGEDTITSKILPRKHSCQHHGQFSFSKSNLLKQNERKSGEDMPYIKIRDERSLRIAREAACASNVRAVRGHLETLISDLALCTAHSRSLDLYELLMTP